jgi:hypothetical protein
MAAIQHPQAARELLHAGENERPRALCLHDQTLGPLRKVVNIIGGVALSSMVTVL